MIHDEINDAGGWYSTVTINWPQSYYNQYCNIYSILRSSQSHNQDLSKCQLINFQIPNIFK